MPDDSGDKWFPISGQVIEIFSAVLDIDAADLSDESSPKDCDSYNSLAVIS